MALVQMCVTFWRAFFRHWRHGGQGGQLGHIHFLQPQLEAPEHHIAIQAYAKHHTYMISVGLYDPEKPAP